MLKHSKHRDSIYLNLLNRYDHPTADEVFEDMRKIYPSISLGTVYRNLSQLVSDNRIQKFTAGGVEHFDANTHNHYHFYCKSCKNIYDIDIKPYDFINGDAEKENIGIIENHSLMFFGICKKCAEKAQK